MSSNLRPLTSLRRWFSEHGGWIHPALAVGPSPVYGVRGVISLEDLPVTESAFGQQAVILMPQALQITAETAKAALADHLSAASLHALQDNGWLVAAMLAHERRKPDSFWQPYIDSLPVRPSAGWFMKPQDSSHALKQLGSLGSGCKADLKAKQKRYSKLAAKYAAQFGKPLGLSTQDLLWGLAMVQCRGYINDGIEKILPVIDLCNHGQHAARVEGIRLPNDEQFVRGSVKRDGQPVPLRAGEELLLNYDCKAGGATACDCFSLYGFIPEDYKHD